MAETRPKHKIRIIRNAARCNHCGDVIESTYGYSLYAYLPLTEQLTPHLAKLTPRPAQLTPQNFAAP